MSRLNWGESTIPSRDRIALVAESDSAVGSLIKTVLVRAGFCVLMADTGNDALRVCSASGLTIEVAVLEVELPDMPGAEVMRLLRLSYPDIAVVFVGADAYDERLQMATPPGPLVTKPFHPEDLLKLIRGVSIARRRQRYHTMGYEQQGTDQAGGRG
jgi:two-component system KDP operon response regulator KdpE